MSTVLYLGRSDRRIETWARAHARYIESSGGRVVFLAPYGENTVDGNFEFINCFSVPRKESIESIQAGVGVSLNRALACDRSLTDYSHYTSYGSYSRYSPDQMEDLVAAIANAVLSVLPRIDYCVDGMYDNLVTPLAFELARSRGVPFYLVHVWHFWHDTIHLCDAPGYTSTRVDALYRRYLARIPESVVPHAKEVLKAAVFRLGGFTNEGWRLRLAIIRDKWASYERPSLRNFLWRRWRRLTGPLGVHGLRFRAQSERPRHYIVFALHVMPEASILGTDPEMADQFSLIRRMSINIPAGVQILCKLHPGDKFGRDLDIGFLQRLCTLPNVSLVPAHETIGTFFSDPRCLATCTINGSVAVESILKDKPCFLFGNGLFTVGDCFLKPATDRQFFEQVTALVSGEYRINQRAFAAIVLAMRRGAVKIGRSWSEPAPWLYAYTALIPAIHGYHLRFGKRADRA